MDDIPKPSQIDFDYKFIVDAIFGFSFKGNARPPFADVLSALKVVTIPVCSVDIPSGEIKQISFLSDVNPFFSELTVYEHRPQYLGTLKMYHIQHVQFVFFDEALYLWCINSFYYYYYYYYYYLFKHSLCWFSFCASAGCKPCTKGISYSSQSFCSYIKHLLEDLHNS